MKLPAAWGSVSFRVGKHVHTGRVTHPDSMMMETPALGTLPDPTACLIDALSICVLQLIL